MKQSPSQSNPQDDRTENTPPDIPLDVVNEFKKNLLQHPYMEQMPPRKKRIFFIHTHGCSINNGKKKFPVNVPIVATVKDGETHFRFLADDRTDTLNPPLVHSLARCIEEIQKDPTVKADSSLNQAFLATKLLEYKGFTESDPVKYEIGQEMEDIKLFCSGFSMYDGIYVIDLDTHSIKPANASFGLQASDDRPSSLAKRMEMVDKKTFWNTYNELIKQKEELDERFKLLSIRRDDKRLIYELTRDVNKYEQLVGWYNNERLSRKKVIRHSRLTIKNKSDKTCVSLCTLIEVGIRKSILNPKTDCILVSACRAHTQSPSQPPPPSQPPRPSPQPSKRPHPPSHQPSKRSHPPSHQPSKRPRPNPGPGGGTRKRIRKLNKKTRHRNNPKSRKRKH
jgi:hypothetical protein